MFAFLKSKTPPQIRRRARQLLSETPHRLRDALPDLFHRRSDGLAVPPARLRLHVGNSSSRSDFIAVGAHLTEEILDCGDGEALPATAWLDFGCGSGRVARHLLQRIPGAELTGVDVHRPAIAWCSRHLPGRYLAVQPSPPLPFKDNSFDHLVSISVFTHLCEDDQFRWLQELARVTKPGGRLIASTHAPDLLSLRPDLGHLLPQLQSSGFLFGGGHGRFNEDTAYHSEAYLRTAWAPWFTLRAYRPKALGGFQDLSVFELTPKQRGPRAVG